MGDDNMESRRTASQPASDAEGDAVVHVDGVSKRFGSLLAVDDVSIPVRDGEFLTILGPSGAGKTTLLHMIVGFETPTEGEIYINDRPVSDEPPYERDIGLVFQSLALFPHMTVKGNIAFPLKMRRENPVDIDRKVEETLELVRLPPEYTDKPVTDLSGGQQQRVGLARAVVYEPTLLLLDEPLSSLDKKLREEMRAELSRIHDETDLTIVHVTHNQTEALSMSDRIAVINDGQLEQLAPTQTVYAEPATPFVAEFIGNTTMFSGTVSAVDDNGGIATVGGIDVAFRSEVPVDCGDDISLGLRSERVALGDRTADLENAFEGTVEQASFEGDRTQYRVSMPGVEQTLQATRHDPGSARIFSRGESLTVGWAAEDTLAYPR